MHRLGWGIPLAIFLFLDGIAGGWIYGGEWARGPQALHGIYATGTAVFYIGLGAGAAGILIGVLVARFAALKLLQGATVGAAAVLAFLLIGFMAG